MPGYERSKDKQASRSNQRRAAAHEGPKQRDVALCYRLMIAKVKLLPADQRWPAVAELARRLQLMEQQEADLYRATTQEDAEMPEDKIPWEAAAPTIPL